jgi:lipopolysaccharide biosynthesis glycosyltransferase
LPYGVTTIEIACASDDRYAAHTAALWHSLRWHAPGAALRVHFLAGPALSGGRRARLARFADKLRIELRWIEVPDALVASLPARDYLPRVVWYRVFMPQLLPELDRVLYLDSDVIAMASVEPLWDMPLDGELFAAATNVVPAYHAERAGQLGLPGPAAYFNLGVALWNLRAMRGEGFTDAVLEYARANLPRLLWLEQDAINALYWRRRRPLHPRWNCLNAITFGSWGTRFLDPAELREALAAPALVHFEGGSFGKPWHFLSRHPLRDRYFFHRRRTPWPLALPAGITPKNILKRYLPARALDWLRQVLR